MPRLSVELLARCCCGQAKRRREESLEAFLARVTHLYCAERGLEDMDGLSVCRSVSVLYLYDNQIREITGVSSCPLTHLYLQNNLITTVRGLGTLHRLTKLYLSGNAITVLEGLEGLTSLSELHVAHQRLPEGEKLLFEPRSLLAIAPSLTVLNVSGNGLDTVDELKCLRELTHFSAMENQLGNMKALSRVLSQWPRIWRVDLSGNPLCSKVKYRDRVITMGACIGVVDAREVSDTEREFLLNWKAMRRARQKQQRAVAARVFGGEGGLPVVARHPLAPPPLSLPALPARHPPRLKPDNRHRKGACLEPGLHMEVGGLTDSTTDHHTLPDLTLPDLHHRKTGSGNTAHHSTRIGGREPGNGRLKKRYGYSSREQQYGDLSPLKELSSGGAWRSVAVADRVM